MTMDINDTPNRIRYTAVAGQTTFAVPFEFFDKGEIKVYKNRVVKALDADYTVTGANVTGGGHITLTVSATQDDDVLIIRDVPVARYGDFPKAGVFDVESLNLQLDKLTAMTHDLETRIDRRSIRLNVADLPEMFSELPPAEQRADLLLGFDSKGDIKVLATSAAEDALLSAVQKLYDDFDDRYLGPKATPPSLDNDNMPLQVGAIYFNTTDNSAYFYSQTGWVSLKGPKGDTGVAGPTGATGAQGLRGPEGPQGPQGLQGVHGVQGSIGPAGPTGPSGPVGATGPTGATGTAGPSGGVWRSGNGVPANTLGADGDYYLNSATGQVYKKAGGAYAFVVNIMGPAGSGSGDMSKSAYDPDGDGKVTAAVSADTVPWTGVTGVPSTFPSIAHSHDMADVNGLDAALAALQPLDADLTELSKLSGNGYVVRLIDGYAVEATSFAPTDSPAFTGAPTGPTAAAYMNNQMLANTAHVYSTVTTQPENYVVGNYTLALTDRGKVVCSESSSASTITVPAYSKVAFPTNTRLNVLQLGTGAVSLLADTGVTILSSDSSMLLGGQFNNCTLWNHSRDVWVLSRGQDTASLASKADINHTHAYLPLTGGTLSGNLEIGNGDPYMRLHRHGAVYWDLKAMGDGACGIYNNAGQWGWYSVGTSLHVPGDVIAFWSDRRLKEEVQPLEGYEARIMGLRPVSFQWNERGQKLTGRAEGHREIGFIAQDVKAVSDQFVGENKTADAPEGEDPYLTVKKDEMIADLVAMVQNLNQRLAKLEGML